LAFAIVEGETKEALIWFVQLLREHVTPQSNLCFITDRGKGILATLQFEEVQWEADGLQSVYCIRHIASNFNKKFKNHELKNRLKNMGNKIFVSVTIFDNKLTNIIAFLQLTRSNNPYSMLNWRL